MAAGTGANAEHVLELEGAMGRTVEQVNGLKRTAGRNVNMDKVLEIRDVMEQQERELHSEDVHSVAGADASADQLVEVQARSEAMNEQVSAVKAALCEEVSMLSVQDVEDTLPVIKAALEQQETNGDTY